VLGDKPTKPVLHASLPALHMPVVRGLAMFEILNMFGKSNNYST
jgi:hypothetical protein